MKKDKAWLIQKVSDIFWRVEIDGNFNIQNANIMFDDISNLIDALDEPETLSQEWIDENKVARIDNLRKMTTSDVVTVEKLKNLLVPKQGKPVIPQFVADWIESQDDPIYGMCVDYEMWGVNGDDGTTRFTGEIAEWFDDTLNVENYYRACIDGYEVEKEKRHFIKEPVTGQFLIRDDSQSRGVKWVDGFSTSPSYFTETEIKTIDERYWAFAEEVTE